MRSTVMLLYQPFDLWLSTRLSTVTLIVRTFSIFIAGFMSCISVGLDWFIGLDNDQVQGHSYFSYYIGAFLGAKKAEIIY